MSLNVLVVEPFEDLRFIIADALRREHYACDAVGTAEEGDAALHARDYNYVVVDLESTGDFVSSLDPSAHVIVLTENDSYRGQHPTLLKPFSRDELMLRLT